MHYLDNAATCPVLPQAAKAVYEALNNNWANPSQTYLPGVQAEGLVLRSRKTIADILSCKSSELYFTASGTEGNNIALWGGAAGRRKWADNIVVCAYEHPSVMKAAEEICKEYNWNLTIVSPGTDGTIETGRICAAINSKTAVVAAMHANNETGAVIDVAALAALVKEKNRRAAFHVDGIQAFCKLPIKLGETLIDSYSVSGHKICAPKGIGALYIRQGHNIRPIMQGGGQEKGIRPGTENTPYISALATAAEIMSRKDNITPVLHDLLVKSLAKIEGIKINSPKAALKGILNISLPGINGETMMNYLAEREIYVSMGSACSGKSPSHTLTAMGFSLNDARQALRISFNRLNNEDDIKALAACLEKGINELQRI